MDDQTIAQIRLICEHEADLATKAVVERTAEIYRERTLRKCLMSSGTRTAVIRAVEGFSTDLAEKLPGLVSSVSRDPTAFALMETCLQVFLDGMTERIAGAFAMSTGRARGGIPEQIRQSAVSNFAVARTRIARRLELHRFNFSEDRLAHDDMQCTSSQDPATRNRGGKPLARHWDAMWAHIAVRLYSLDLEPKTQADIAEAMMDWFASQDIEIGETAVRQRARQLWAEYQKVEK